MALCGDGIVEEIRASRRLFQPCASLNFL